MAETVETLPAAVTEGAPINVEVDGGSSTGGQSSPVDADAASESPVQDSDGPQSTEAAATATAATPQQKKPIVGKQHTAIKDALLLFRRPL